MTGIYTTRFKALIFWRPIGSGLLEDEGAEDASLHSNQTNALFATATHSVRTKCDEIGHVQQPHIELALARADCSVSDSLLADVKQLSGLRVIDVPALEAIDCLGLFIVSRTVLGVGAS
jgi:hypothetical protein